MPLNQVEKFCALERCVCLSVNTYLYFIGISKVTNRNIHTFLSIFTHYVGILVLHPSMSCFLAQVLSTNLQANILVFGILLTIDTPFPRIKMKLSAIADGLPWKSHNWSTLQPCGLWHVLFQFQFIIEKIWESDPLNAAVTSSLNINSSYSLTLLHHWPHLEYWQEP